MSNQIPTETAVRLSGTNAEIKLCLAVLTDKGFTWDSNGKYYPQRGENNKFAYYLNNLKLPKLGVAVAQTSTPGQPQPQPWDAVLGGKNKPEI